jgi:hypothetical protein
MDKFSDFIKEEKNNKSDDAYEAFFARKLKQWGVESPEEIPDDKKDDFFDEVDKEWKADKEED